MAKKFRFSFDFGLKPGEDGDPGNDGRDGIDGRDGVDGIDGTDGLDGISPRFRYAKTANKDTEPTYIEDNINPGSNWGAVIPLHTSPEAIWMIQAEVSRSNELLSNWTIPVRITGVDGMDAEPPLPPNYKIFVFKESETLPAKPTYTNVDAVDKQGWIDFPDTSSGTWWEVTGNVNGVTGDIIEWGEPIRKTPVITDNEDGEDGDSTETRRAYGQSASTAPSVNRVLREPPGWEIDLGTPPAGNYYVWEITARIKADNTLGGTPAQWSVPYRLTGNIGVSVVPEYRWAVNTSLTTPPAINVENRNPGAAWSTTMPIPGEDEYVWETVALINDDNELYSVWSNPVRKTGERGPQGQTGPIGERGPTGLQGTSGIPGVSYENRFSLGTESGFSATFNSTVAQTRNPQSNGWSLDIPETTEQNPYIWMIQARIQRATNEDPTGALEGVWSTPFMLTGLNGLPGESRDAQVVYPQGTYDNNTTYVATDRVAPYVLDPLDGNFYVMNFIGEYRGADNNNVSPAQDYANNAGVFWHLIPAHEAIYTKLGIIANGLIGEAVFNEQYMFSQGGVNAGGSTSTNYELFDPSTPSGGAFTPNMMINFANGEARFARGNVILGANGDVEIKGKLTSTDGKIGNLIVDSIQTEAQNERTTIGFTPSDSSDPTDDFSRHSPRGYYPSGRIGWTISYVPSDKPVVVGTNTISDAYALIFYKDEAGSPVHGAFSSNLSDVVFAGSQTSYSPRSSIYTELTSSSLTVAQIRTWLDSVGMNWQYLWYGPESKNIYLQNWETKSIYRKQQQGQPTYYVTGTTAQSGTVVDGWYMIGMHPVGTIDPPSFQPGVWGNKIDFIRIVGGQQVGQLSVSLSIYTENDDDGFFEYVIQAVDNYQLSHPFSGTVSTKQASSVSVPPAGATSWLFWDSRGYSV